MYTYGRQHKSAELSRIADSILRAGKVVEQRVEQSTGPHKVSVEWIKQNATPAGGYKADQVKLLGISYPLAHGWMQSADGKIISNEARRKFESFHEGYKASKKSRAVMESPEMRKPRPIQKQAFFVEPCAVVNTPPVAGCNCDVLPWEDCEHTVDDREAQAMLDRHMSKCESKCESAEKCEMPIK